MRGVVLGHHHQARRAAIEPVDDPRPLLAADPAQIVDVMEQRVHERAARVAGRRVHHHARRFIDDDQVLVLVDNGQGQRFGTWRRFSRLGDIDRDFLADPDRLVRPGVVPADAHLAFLDQPLNLRPRPIREHRDEKAIEADALAVVRDGERVIRHARGQAAFRGFRLSSGTGASWRAR